MKKLALILAMLLIFASACAEGLDFASMSDEQLQAVIDGAQAELDSRKEEETSDGTVLIDQDGVKMIMTDAYENRSFGYVYIDIIIENNRDKTVAFECESARLNDWETYAYYGNDIGAGMKRKNTLEFYLDDANISTMDEVEKIEMNFILLEEIDDCEYMVVATFDPIILTL